MADEGSLLESLLEYTITVLQADHATFCEVQNSPEVITVLAASGSLSHPEVLPGMGQLVSDELGYDGEDERSGATVGVYRRGDPATPGVTAFLDRIGCAFDVTIRVYQDEVRTHLLEVYYVEDREFAEPQIREAEQLGALLTTVISRDRLMQQLEQAETRFRTLVQQIPAIPYIVDAEYHVLFQSSRLSQLLGLEVDEAVFEDWANALHPEDRDRVVARYESHMTTGASYEEEYRMVATDGSVVWFHDRATLLPGAGGAPTLSHGVMFDVTERRRTEEALRRSEVARQEVLEAMLHAEAAARAQIAGDLHDDTIQVMTAALMAVERVSLAAADGDPRVVEALSAARSTLQTAVERARRLTFELRPPLLDAQGLAAALRDLTAEAERESGFTVSLEAPSGRFSYTVEDLAFRTVKEALANARKHSEARHVQVRLWTQDGWLHGRIADDGRGFDVERALDRRGMRLHIGLDSMRERVRLAGGEVTITSAPGQGARVDFAVPLAGQPA
ncbi:MAG TPA: PAS domain-containing protein [Gaiellales bacterium]|nr:PAS domain-containing protein [Gaiellales bacterium]